LLAAKIAFLLSSLEGLAAAQGLPTRGTASDLLRDESGRIPEEMTGFRLISARQDEAIHLVFTLDPARPAGENLVEFTLTPRDPNRPAVARSRSFNIEYRGPMVGGRPAPAVAPLVEAVVAAIERNDPGGLLIAPPKPAALGEGAQVPLITELADRASAWAGLLLVLAFLLCLPWTVRGVGSDLRAGLARMDAGGRNLAAWTASISAVCGLLVRLLAPHRPVMYYMGYHLADTAARLEGIPKYGSGALAFYHLLFRVTGTDHLAMMYANSVLGAGIPLVAGALLARVGASAWSVAGAVSLLAWTPVFIRDATTESLLVPATLWMLSGIVLFLRAREDRKTSTLALSILHLLLAMYSRPEAVVLVPVCAGLFALFARNGERERPSLWPWALAALFLVVRLAQLAVSLQVEFSRGNNPVLRDVEALAGLLPDLWRRNLVFWPDLFPAGVTLLGVVGVLSGPRRWVAIALLAAALLWLGVSLVDLPYVSIPRVQVPGALFWTLGAGIGFGAIASRFRGRRILGLVGSGILAANLVWTVPGLWAPTNADDEEQLLRDARRLLPADEPFILVRRGYDDQPVERLHLYYPDYWFEPPMRPGLAVGPDWFRKTDVAGRTAYFLLGTRCYMRPCGETSIHPACRRMLESYRLEPLVERTVPVRRLPVDRAVRPDQDLDFPWCLSERDEMKIGLYKVVGATRKPADAAADPVTGADGGS